MFGHEVDLWNGAGGMNTCRGGKGKERKGKEIIGTWFGNVRSGVIDVIATESFEIWTEGGATGEEKFSSPVATF